MDTMFEDYRATTMNDTGVSEKETLGRSQNQPQHDSSIFSLLNTRPLDDDQGSKQDNNATRAITTTTTARRDEHLPTPVTPASGFPSALANKHATVAPTPAAGEKNSLDTPKSQSSPSSPLDDVAFTFVGLKHASSQKQYTCLECNQTFSRPHNLKSHLTTHSSERPFQCTTCKLYFRRHHDLKRHEKLHTGEKPFSCHVCHRSFGRLDALTRHRRAQGGTACSAAHRQQTWNNKTLTSPSATSPAVSLAPTATAPRSLSTPQPSSRNISSSNSGSDGLPPSSSRPIVPQLHIPHPASQPLGNEAYSYPTVVTTSITTSPLPISPRNPLPPNHPSPRDVLPSLSHLSVSDNTSLVPIKRRHNSDSSVTSSRHGEHHASVTASTPTTDPFCAPRSMADPGGGSWATPTTPSDRTLPPPASLRHSPVSATPPPVSHPQHAMLEQLHALRQQVSYWKARCDEVEELKSRLHDAEVENKLLRSLITETRQPKKHHSEPPSSEKRFSENDPREKMIMY